MVLSRVLAEQWTYGFCGVVMTHSMFFPAGVHQFAWFAMSWLFVHSADPPIGQYVLHVHHAAMVWLGALVGWLFVKCFKTPRFVSVDLVKKPAEAVFLVSAIFLATAAYLGLSKANFFTKPSAFPEGTETGQTIVLVACAVVGPCLAIASVVTLLSTKQGATSLKYTVGWLAFVVLANMSVAQHPVLTVVYTALAYFLTYSCSSGRVRLCEIMCGQMFQAWKDRDHFVRASLCSAVLMCSKLRFKTLFKLSALQGAHGAAQCARDAILTGIRIASSVA